MLSPFRRFGDPQSQIDRLFGGAPGQVPQTSGQATWALAADLTTEDGDAII